MRREEYRAIEAYMLTCMGDAAHDREHVYRVLYGALDIARHETGADLDVLTAAALLHDVGRPEQFADPAVCHAEAGSVKAFRFLTGLGWDAGRAGHVRDCVLTHRTRTDRRPATLEAKIIFDADKLDVSGAVGVARSLFYGGEIGQPLYRLDGDGEILTDPGSPPSFLREFNYKLRGLYGGFHTARARELALQRREAATAFYDALLSELEGCRRRGRPLLEALLED